jgi:hypothetical protein
MMIQIRDKNRSEIHVMVLEKISDIIENELITKPLHFLWPGQINV